eukprot:superscaffoldBa00000665_g6437
MRLRKLHRQRVKCTKEPIEARFVVFTYHLKASCEVERQRWITALELAKAKAARMQAESDDSGDDFSPSSPPAAPGQGGGAQNSEVQSALRTLGSKVEDLSTCNDLISKHGSALQRSLSELDSLRLTGEAGDKIRQVTERATLFRITSNAMINACRDFLALAQAHSKRWQKALQAEREQRVRLEETLEQLAKQHNNLERAFRGAAQANTATDNKSTAGPGKGEASDEDDDNEFFDAMEEAPEFITVPADPQFHKRSSSNISGFNSEMCPDDQSLNEEPLAMNQESPSQELVPLKKRRTRIPDKPNYSLNLWSIMKNCIGKELSKIPMPVNFNEPISMLQRLSEDLEYHELLDKASKCQSSLEQMCYVAAFSVSSYSTTVHRTGKPFNPLLGETFELDRRRESGYRSLCEQVSHHPPAAAHHVISDRGWTLRQEITVASKFRGKYLSIMPLGTIHAIFEKGNNHYTWKKVTTTVHNIIVGKLWIDQSGEIDVVNHTTGDRCHLKFAPYSYFSRDVARKVTGVVMDKDGKAHYVLSGTWDEKMEFSRVMQSSRGGENGTEGKQKTVYQTLKAREVWRRNPLLEGAEAMYYFTALALTLNEPEDAVAPTDSRRRPDQRLMEDGRWEEANAEKQRLEEKQRIARREREREAASQRTSSQSEEGENDVYLCPNSFCVHLMTTTEHFGSIAARTRSQVSKCISIKEATGKPRNVATGRAARTYFDHGIDCKSALMRLIHQSPLVDNYRKGLLVPYFGRLLSLQRFSVLRDLQDAHSQMEVEEVVCLPKLTRVAVCGGTHGNELSGVYLVRELLKAQQKREEEEPMTVMMVLSNPRAMLQCRRYIDTDLNRCFTHAILNGPESDMAPYEMIRSRELNAMLGPKGSPEAVDFVCDLHNTTANMGLCLIAYSDTIEIGPQAHGVVRSNVYTAMKLGVQHMLDWIRSFNSGATFEGGCVEVFTMVKHIDYPRDKETRHITAAIHPQLQDRDFCLLHPEDPLFQTFSGETLRYKGREPLYPFFINECAYYEKGIALSLARKRCVMIPAVRVQTEQEQQQANEQGFASEEEED